MMDRERNKGGKREPTSSLEYTGGHGSHGGGASGWGWVRCSQVQDLLLGRRQGVYKPKDKADS